MGGDAAAVGVTPRRRLCRIRGRREEGPPPQHRLDARIRTCHGGAGKTTHPQAPNDSNDDVAHPDDRPTDDSASDNHDAKHADDDTEHTDDDTKHDDNSDHHTNHPDHNVVYDDLSGTTTSATGPTATALK